MDDDIRKAWLEYARAANATWAETVDLAKSPDGDIVLIEASNPENRASLLLPSTQIPPFSMALLQAWLDTRGKSDGRQLAADMPRLAPLLLNSTVMADDAGAALLDNGTIRIGFRVGGVPICLGLPKAGAAGLVRQILAALEADEASNAAQQ